MVYGSKQLRSDNTVPSVEGGKCIHHSNKNVIKCNQLRGGGGGGVVPQSDLSYN